MAAYALPGGDNRLLYGCDLCSRKEVAIDDDELERVGWHVTHAHAFCPDCKAPDGRCEPCADLKALLR